ncbi:MAG: HAMP domain-containing protein [Verrucomicrobia bacterium]|nr:HAMP domain-containing protein [Verrucomicrobiota bacterium]
MSFRARLLQTFLTLVIITTGAAMIIAQRQNEVMLQGVVNELFKAELKTFHQTQELSVEAAKAKGLHLARSVRLFAALEEGDPEEIYHVADAEMQLGWFDFFRLLNAEGKLIPRGAATTGTLPDQDLTEDLLPHEIDDTDVELGFAANRQGAVYRLLACTIRKFDQTVGTLVLGQALPRETSLLIDGKFLGSGIPEALHAPLMAQTGENGRFRADGIEYRFTRFTLNKGSHYPSADWVSVLSMAQMTQQQRVLAWRILLTGAVALGISALVIMQLSRQIAQPVANLVKAAERVRSGNYDVQLPPTRTIEMTQLGSAFNEMAAGLALRDRYQSILQKVTDPRVAEELVAGRVKLGGELREVSVIFCDIRGYTALSAGRNPVEVIHLLNDHMGALAKVVQRHHGVINQFAGDAIMILFGAPKSYGEDAADALRCAWEMMEERERLNREAAEPLLIGIGIATGEMVAGCIGAESRSEYTVIGEKTNLAARMCSAAGAGQIILDTETQQKTASIAVFTALEPLALKGFTHPVSAFRLASLNR